MSKGSRQYAAWRFGSGWQRGRRVQKVGKGGIRGAVAGAQPLCRHQLALRPEQRLQPALCSRADRGERNHSSIQQRGGSERVCLDQRRLQNTKCSNRENDTLARRHKAHQQHTQPSNYS